MSDTKRPRILVVEDEPSFANRLARNLELDGFDPRTANGFDAARDLFLDNHFDAVMTDLRMPGKSGLDLIDEIQRISAEGESGPPPILVLTSIGDIPTVVDAMRRGASDYLTKEASREEIALRLRNLLKTGQLATEVKRLRKSLDRLQDSGELVGQSVMMEEVRRLIAEIAPSEATVLITGETGCGKELVARAVHRQSGRAGEAFIEVNCAALPDENLFLSELFGHERGAFTGALQRKRGQFELADGGTLFLDEVAELGPMAQARLLRAVETLEFTRLGGEKPIKVNCRLVFATNRQLEGEIEAGRFRRDLFYRINVCRVQVPPLRSRTADVPPLARHFAATMAEKHHLAPITLGDDAIEALRANPWPGNVRELRNVIERLSIRFGGKTVTAQNLKELDLAGGSGGGAAAGVTASAASIILPEGGLDLAALEKSLVLQALERGAWSQRAAADLLGISVDRMNARVKKFNITHPSWRVHK